MSEYIYGTDDNEGHWLTSEEIVRCYDCENASFDGLSNGWCCENRREIKPLDFCAWGERKQQKWHLTRNA